MSTKPKTRKAPAAEKIAAAPAPTEASAELKREISDICRLVNRWRFLEADQTYRAAIAETNTESDRLLAIHRDEQREIENKLARLFPESQADARCLMDFAIDMVEEGGRDGLEIAMLRNVQEGLSQAWRKDMDAERVRGIAEARRDVAWTFDTMDGIRARHRAEKQAAPNG